MRQDRRPWFRWKALAPLALFFAFLALLWGLFADMVARRSLEEAATQVLGTQVDIGWLRIRERRAGVEIGEPIAVVRDRIHWRGICHFATPSREAARSRIHSNTSDSSQPIARPLG